MEIDARVLSAVARTRAEGMHFWGQMTGVSLVERSQGTTRLRLAAENADDVTALATLTDLALGFAIRSRAGSGRRLATTSLSLQHTATARGPVDCTSRVVWSGDDGRALSEATLEDEGGALVGLARAWFLVTPLPERAVVVPMPWEREPVAVPVLTADDLDPTERAAAVTASQALARSAASGLATCEELLGATWTAEGPDTMVGTAPIGPHLGNRIGDVQGGAMYGLAATAARHLAGPGRTIVDGAVQYLRPGRGDRMGVTARALRRGRRAAFIDADVLVDDRLAATAHFTILAD